MASISIHQYTKISIYAVLLDSLIRGKNGRVYNNQYACGLEQNCIEVTSNPLSQPLAYLSQCHCRLLDQAKITTCL